MGHMRLEVVSPSEVRASTSSWTSLLPSGLLRVLPGFLTAESDRHLADSHSEYLCHS